MRCQGGGPADSPRPPFARSSSEASSGHEESAGTPRPAPPDPAQMRGRGAVLIYAVMPLASLAAVFTIADGYRSVQHALRQRTRARPADVRV